MTMLPGMFPLQEVLATLTEQVVMQQERLDAEYQSRVQDFTAVWQAAQAEGQEALARQIAPDALLIQQSDIQIQFRFAASEEREFALSVRLLNLGYQRRYAHSDFVKNALQLSVQRIPIPVDRESKK